MLKEKTLSPLSKVKIYLEVSFYQVLLYQEIKAVPHLLIVQVKVEQLFQTQVQTQRVKLFLLSKKYFQDLKV